MAAMEFQDGFATWVEAEIGTVAAAALKQNLSDRGYKIYSGVDEIGRSSREIYHPRRGFFMGQGIDEAHALLGVLRQIWLIEDLITEPEPEVGPTDRR
jgi:hypothetical protein